jgi:AbiJ-like protein
MKFSQRIGETTATKLVQIESIDDDLKNSLWNAITLIFFDEVNYNRNHHGESKHCNLTILFTCLWIHHFKKPIDEIPYYFSDTVSSLKEWLFSATWYQILDFVEACSKYGPDDAKENFIRACNSYLERENSAYRFINQQLAEITSELEIEAVDQALNISDSYGGTKKHLETALSLMSDRSKPDYRNSIKESISAVESLAKILSGNDKATLGEALKVIEKNGNLHQALKSAFSSLYGYTNDAEGIRHALLEESTLKKADARFMLVSCSNFVNYLIELSDEQNSQSRIS